jgi:hypothetical protein
MRSPPPRRFSADCVALIVGALITAFALVRTSRQAAWAAAVLLPAGAIIGYT